MHTHTPKNPTKKKVLFIRQGLSLGNSIEVYDAEAIAMLEGLKHALKSPMARVAPEFISVSTTLGWLVMQAEYLIALANKLSNSSET